MAKEKPVKKKHYKLKKNGINPQRFTAGQLKYESYDGNSLKGNVPAHKRCSPYEQCAEE